MLCQSHMVRLGRQSEGHLVLIHLDGRLVLLLSGVWFFVRAQDIAPIDKGTVLLVHLARELLVHGVSVQLHKGVLLQFLVVVVAPQGLTECVELPPQSLQLDPRTVVQLLGEVYFLLLQLSVDLKSLHFSQHDSPNGEVGPAFPHIRLVLVSVSNANRNTHLENSLCKIEDAHFEQLV